MRKIVQILRKMAARQQIGWYSNMGNNTNAQYLDQDPSGPILLNTARPGLLACRGGKVDRKLWAIVRLIHEGAHVLDEEDQFPKGSGSSAEEEFKANQAALAVYRAYKRLYGYCDTDMEERQRLAETFVTRQSKNIYGKLVTYPGLQNALRVRLYKDYPHPKFRKHYTGFPQGGVHFWSKEPLAQP
jgi:hypothetical protein